MKTISFFLIIVFLFLISETTKAQDAYDHWAIGLSINAVNNPISKVTDPVRGIPIERGRYAVWNMSNTGFRLTASRYIDHGFVFDAVISNNKILDNYINEEVSYVSVDGILRHNLNPKKNRVKPFNPYVGIGIGYTWLKKVGTTSLNATIGSNFWVNRNFGFNIQSTIKYPFKDTGIEHFQHSVGVVYRFAKADADNDGVPNRLDKCPGVKGKKELNGCPDRDGDGIINDEDECPRQAGLIEFNGCPDTDKDKIPDHLDQCPEVYGFANNEGCPNPDSDRDGIKDNEDKCPNQAGPISNNGCPEILITKESQDKINKFARTLLFNYGKNTLRDTDRIALDEIVIIMQKYPKSKFYIDGHTDNTSGASHNLKLSRKRANSVKQYLVKKGIDTSRLRARGFGETRPIANNKTKEGRRKNRRVEIILFN